MSVMRRLLPATLLTIFLAPPAFSQFLPDLQAKTPEEYDAYLDVLDGPVLERGAPFEQKFPQSALRLPVCELIAKAWRSKGNAAEAIAAAERGLSIAPDYPPLLVELADLLSNESRNLDRAEWAARRALGLLSSAKSPLRITPEEWIKAVSRYRARAHAALGMVRFKTDDTKGAIQEFEAALVDNSGDALLQYRLGKLYAVSGRVPEAREQLAKAAQSEDKVLRERARAALAEIR
jgi:tetratricopeptide (TPR) repeat protein